MHHEAKQGEWVLGFNAFASAASNYSCRRSSARASVWREVFISQDDVSHDVSPALSPLGARFPKARLRARPEKDDKLEVNDEQPDRKGGEKPYD